MPENENKNTTPPTVENKPQPKVQTQKSAADWYPQTTLKDNLIPKGNKVYASVRILSKPNGDNVVKRETKIIKRPTMESFPLMCCRKYNLWAFYEISEQDKNRLMNMRVNEVIRLELRHVQNQMKSK